jgi:hypothetical protein
MRGDAAGTLATEAAMNELLAARYRALFFAYDVGGSPDIADLRARIAAQMAPRGRLRPDAALLLLLMADQMLLRPYLGAVPGRDGVEPLPEFAPQGAEALRAHLRDVLPMVIERSAAFSRGEAISAHAVLRATDSLWPQLAELFDWA